LQRREKIALPDRVEPGAKDVPAEAEDYRLVRLSNGTHSLQSVAYGETCHPAVGPVIEAQTLYVRQLRLTERLAQHQGEFVVWDVGLGGGANALTVLRAAETAACSLRLVSFDQTLAALKFALTHAHALGYFTAYEKPVDTLLRNGEVALAGSSCRVHWTLRVGDFPALLNQPESCSWPKPHAILFDPFSPAKNPAMWTAPLFARLFQLLDPCRPCALATYSRSTVLRVALLLAGFHVGAGRDIGRKEETTVAANVLDLIETPLDGRWLRRARESDSAEPLWEPIYRKAKLAEKTWNQLRECRQFREGPS
jgi:tRNA U34 5-methylaminomethyl-2-thiouridine-forming methyltransferase MnmC